MTTFMDAFAAERRTTTPRKPRTPLLVHAGRAAAKLLPRWATVRTATLSMAGLGLLTTAAWQIAIPLGLAAAGLSLLVLEALSGGDRR